MSDGSVDRKNEIIRNLEWDNKSLSNRVEEQHDKIKYLNTVIKNFELENENLMQENNECERFKGNMKQFLGINNDECKGLKPDGMEEDIR